MEIIIDLAKNKNYNTELFNFLSSLPDDILYADQHKLRKPLGIYNVSVHRVYKAFDKAIDSIQAKSIDLEKLDFDYKELLDSLMAFIDDGYHMMKCLYPISRVKKEIIFADKWLKEADAKTITDYQNKISEYRDILAKIVNKIKHNHARFCHIKLSTNIGTILGYYVEGVDNEGAIGPDAEIHKMFNKMHTAFSYNRDIKYHLINFYFVARAIKETMGKIIYASHNKQINIVNVEDEKNKSILETCSKINSLRHIYFIDEYTKPLPQIEIDEKSMTIKFRFPSTKIYIDRLFYYRDYKAEAVMSGDGVTRTWKLPYF